jgi:hypothetical protein
MGIVGAPLLHGDWEHLFSNSIPLLVLGTCFIFFYRKVAWQAGFWLYILPGVSLWIMGRREYHIGASGIVYSLAFFLLLSGFIRNNKSLKAISLIVIMLYGSLVWGVFPINPEISWEGHLGGMMSGIMLAMVYRKQGPEDEKPVQFDDSDLDEVEPYWEIPDEGVEEEAKPVVFRYRYKREEGSTKREEGSGKRWGAKRESERNGGSFYFLSISSKSPSTVLFTLSTMRPFSTPPFSTITVGM